MRISMIVLFAAVIMASGCVDLDSADDENTSMQEEIDIKKEATNIPYSNLVNYPERVKGDYLKGRGKVEQIFDNGTQGLILSKRIDRYGRESYYGREPIYTTFQTSIKPEEDVIINYWGNVEGTETYENKKGVYVTVPKITIERFNKNMSLEIEVAERNRNRVSSEYIKADKICLNSNCVYNTSNNTFSIQYGENLNITIEKEGYYNEEIIRKVPYVERESYRLVKLTEKN